MSIAASNIDDSLYQPKYLVQIWKTFSEFNLFLSCSFLMHKEGMSCVDNQPGEFSLGNFGQERMIKCDGECQGQECE